MRKLLYILGLLMVFSCASAKAQNYKTHKVQAGETLEQIAKQYNVSKSSVLALNPDARKGLKVSSVLIIPKQGVVVKEPETTTKETKTLLGFKTHKVKRKETLYSLSKEYDVTQEDIKKHNPELYANNLRKGDRIKIPEYKIVKEVVETKSPLTTYTVQPKEGKWRIAYKCGITVQELEDLNPAMNDVLQPGDVVNVPNKEAETIKEVDEKYSYYTVLPKEGFYRIKLKTGLTQEDLEKLNPELEETGLEEGMVLKIPFKGSNSTIEGVVSSMTTNAGKVDLTKSNINPETKKIAIMLPFGLNKVNTDSIYDTKKQIETDRYLSVSLDFYTGVKVALDSLQELGVNLKVDVFDTQNRESEVASILRRNDFSETSAVIGPLMPKLFNEVALSLKKDNVPIISPLTKTVDLGDNVFQSRPSEDMLEDAIINYFKKDSTAHAIIISDKKHKSISDKLKREFTRASVLSSRTERKTGKDAYYVLDQDIINVLKQGKNVVFLETDNPGFVSNVSSLLNSKIVTGTNIILTTTKMDKAFEDEEVRNTHLSNLNFTYSDIKKSFNEDENNSFAKRYKSTYNELPNSYATRGFDITMDIVLRLVTSEDLYMSANQYPLTTYVENKFAYKKKLFGGYYNDAVYLVKYSDLKIVEVTE